ncbi:hypothetical protein [Reinekea blandensis]|nr:hypothetical protein [Reinekea blandensis]
MSRVKRLLVLGVVLTLSACASRSVDTELTRCVYPDSPRTPAPSFVCGEPVTGYPVSVLRSSEDSEQSVHERMQATLDDQVVRWSEQLADDWYPDDASVNAQARAFLLDWLQDNARIVRSRVSPTATLWLLVGIPDNLNHLRQLTQDALSNLPN